MSNRLESLNAQWNQIYNEQGIRRSRESYSQSIDSDHDNQNTRVRLNTVVRKDSDDRNDDIVDDVMSPLTPTTPTVPIVGLESITPLTESSSSKTPKNTLENGKKGKRKRKGKTSIYESWSESGAIHAMIVLQNIGSTIEIAHVTTYGGCKSFVRSFDAEKIAETIYKRILLSEIDANGVRKSIIITQENKKSVFKRENIYKTTFNKNSKKNSRGPPVVYRCFVYRLQSSFDKARTLAVEAANVAENLVSTGRVLADVSIFSGSSQRYMVDNPEMSFDKYLLNDKTSLFRRPVRQAFDDGTHFFNFSPSEFVINCYHRAIVNRKSFNKELLRILDCDPYITPSPLLQKYIHLNISQHQDWICLGKLFLQFL